MQSSLYVKPRRLLMQASGSRGHTPFRQLDLKVEGTTILQTSGTFEQYIQYASQKTLNIVTAKFSNFASCV